MADPTINTDVLSNVVKLVGVVVSWGVSIYFLWVRKPPAVIAEDHFFDQVRRIAIVVISIFLVLSWGLLGNVASLSSLAWISVSAASVGIIVFFWTVNAIRKHSRDSTPWNTTGVLAGFMLYTVLISWGLTAAVEFIAVFLLNTANASTGTAIVEQKRYLALVRLTGEVDVQSNQDVPFRVSSGQRNFGCEQNAVAEVRYALPPGASLIGQASAAWENTSNASQRDASRISLEQNEIVARASIRGLGFQNFPFGIKNCPGGGHGELVLTGTYRSTVKQRQPKELEIKSTVVLRSEPVWITLPEPTQIHVREALVRLALETDPSKFPWSLTLTEKTPAAETADHVVKGQLQIEQGRLGLSSGS